MFELIVAIASAFGGIVATLAGFGIGSVITPLLAARYGMKVAVAAVAIPHITGTALRFWFLRKSLDRRVLLSFGLPSAIGGLTGALLHSRIGGRALAYLDRKSTRLNSSHLVISYAVLCLKTKKDTER